MEVKDEASYRKAEYLIDALYLKAYSFQPVFDGKNIDFFKKYVFMNKADFETIGLSKREVFANQVLNSNHFGKIIIDVFGDIKCSRFSSAIGNINDDVRSLIIKELRSGKSWLRKRDDVEPCNNCLYKWLCPPISDLEDILGKFNLCTIKNHN